MFTLETHGIRSLPGPGWRVVFAAVTVLTLVAATGCKKEEPPPPPPPPAVKVATVLQKDVPIFLEAIGQTRGAEEIEVRARVEGFLESVNFQEGSLVRQGQLLYTIDPREYQAALAQAKGRLAQAQADLARYEQDVERYRPLVEQNAYPKQNLEQAIAQANAGRANVDAARAQVTKAEIDLSYTKVYSPTDGIVGKTEVNVGNLVGGLQATILTRVSKVANIHVRFTLPERDYLVYARRAQQRRGVAQAGQTPLELVLADGNVHPEQGQLVFVDRNVDPVTGTIMLEASFPNPGAVVRPGQYARVRAAVETKSGAILVPQRSVSELQGIYNVAVVKADDTIEVRMVTPGQRVGNLWVIDSGLKAGDRVVVEGMQKVRPEMKVKPETVTIQEGPAAAPPAAPTADKGETKGAEGN
jgi:membrane fusion protein (multidrug efflux system)